MCKKYFVALILGSLFMCSLVSAGYALDSTAFDPRTVPVKVKAPSSSIPIGAVIEWPHANLPAEYDSAGNPKWLECNGQTF